MVGEFLKLVYELIELLCKKVMLQGGLALGMEFLEDTRGGLFGKPALLHFQ